MVRRSLTLVQAADQGAAGHFRLWAPVVQSLSAPLERRLWSWISHVLLWRHVQPAKKQQEQSSGLENLSQIYFLYRPERKQAAD